MPIRASLPCAILAAAAAALLLTACDTRQNEGSYRARLLGRLPEKVYDELEAKGAAAIPDLEVLMQDPDPVIAKAGLIITGEIKPKDAATPAIPTVIQVMKHADAHVREFARQTLKALQPVSTPLVLDALKSGDPDIRRGALQVTSMGLGKEAKGGIPKLEQIASTGDEQEKVWAAMALASIGSAAERSIPTLERAAESVTKEDDKRIIKGCVKRIQDAHKPGMYTDSR